MARTVTLAQLRADARLYADARTDSQAGAHVTDEELDRLLNQKLAELHELFVSARGDDYDGTIGETTIALVPSTALYSLPAGFFQLLSAELRWASDDVEPLRHISHHAELAQYRTRQWESWGRKGFRVRGGQIEIFPTPTTSVNLVVRYAPAFVDLVADGDTYDGVNGWEKLVTLAVATEMRALEDRPSTAILALYNEQKERIQAIVEQRQAQDPLQVRDVECVIPRRGRFEWLG